MSSQTSLPNDNIDTVNLVSTPVQSSSTSHLPQDHHLQQDVLVPTIENQGVNEPGSQSSVLDYVSIIRCGHMEIDLSQEELMQQLEDEISGYETDFQQGLEKQRMLRGKFKRIHERPSEKQMDLMT
ncbi:hypothetical protein BG011_003919, partial [Mortierella polycephala]